jgi:hypothetical protein
MFLLEARSESERNQGERSEPIIRCDMCDMTSNLCDSKNELLAEMTKED